MLEESAPAGRHRHPGARRKVVRIGPDARREDYERALESGARLGARYITVNGDDPDIEHACETFAALTAYARPYGLWPLIEPIDYT
jgi:hypothetical protein